MGGTRFVVGALQQILLKKKHSARVAILDCSAGAAAAAAAGAAAGGGEAGQKQGDALAAAAAFNGPPVQNLAAFQQLAGELWAWAVCRALAAGCIACSVHVNAASPHAF